MIEPAQLRSFWQRNIARFVGTVFRSLHDKGVIRFDLSVQFFQDLFQQIQNETKRNLKNLNFTKRLIQIQITVKM